MAYFLNNFFKDQNVDLFMEQKIILGNYYFLINANFLNFLFKDQIMRFF